MYIYTCVYMCTTYIHVIVLTTQPGTEEYSTLDHGLGKGGTLPTGVAAPSSDSEYGKLDQVYIYTLMHTFIVYLCTCIMLHAHASSVEITRSCLP